MNKEKLNEASFLVEVAQDSLFASIAALKDLSRSLFHCDKHQESILIDQMIRRIAPMIDNEHDFLTRDDLPLSELKEDIESDIREIELEESNEDED